ncbi:MAG: metallophosphoesterase family protein [Bacteroidota bacterium]
MRTFYSKLALTLLFFSTVTSQTLPWNRIVPSVRISDKNEVEVFWKTVNPTMKAIVFYGPEDGSYRQPFPEYASRISDKASGRSHAIALKGIGTNTLYNYRVSCVDSMNFSEIRSANYTFRVVERDGKLAVGLCLTETPIVANVEPNSVVIAWKTNMSCSGKVNFWTKPDLRNNVMRAVGPKEKRTEFETVVSGLSPNTLYYYQVDGTTPEEKEKTVSATYTFRTAPKTGANTKFSFAAYGDSRGGTDPDFDYHINGVNYNMINKLALSALKKGASFFLQTGDLADGATDNRDDMTLMYETHKKAIAWVNAFIPFYQGIGNHDASAPYFKFGKRGRHDPPPPNSAEDLFARMFVLPENGPTPEPNHPPFLENVYSFDYANAHFISLNSEYFLVRQDDSIRYPYNGYGNRVAGRQLEWLKEDLKKSKSKLLFVYLHDPFYPAGGHVGSSLDRYPSERDSLWRLLEGHNLGLVFAGHEHLYARVAVDKKINPTYKKSIYQIIAGGAGAPLYPQDKKVPYLQNVITYERKFHYVLVTVDGKKWTSEVYDDNENLIDKFGS